MGPDALLGAIDATTEFDTAAQSVVEFVRARVGLEMVAVSRRLGDDYVVMLADDDCYGVAAGDVLSWDDTFCARMADGRAPRVAPDVDAIPAYVEAREILGMDVAAYMTVPIQGEDGLLGTLCGASPRRHSRDLENEQPLLELLAGLLGKLLTHALRAEDAQRRAEIAEAHADTDALTGIGNRRRWERTLLAEDSRCARQATPATIVVLDLDGLKTVNDVLGHDAGDELLRLAADVLASTIRPTDALARLGGDEFGIIASGCDAAGAEKLLRRLRHNLRVAGVDASIGVGFRTARNILLDAWKSADEAMYSDKRKGQRRLIPVS